MGKRLLVWCAATLSFFGPGCGSAPSETPKGTPRPEVEAAVFMLEPTAMEAAAEVVGTVRAGVSSTIQSKSMGHVLAVHVREGDTVDAGALLVEVDDREVQARVDQAEAGLRAAQDARREIESAVRAAVQGHAAAEASSELARVNYERFQRLLADSAISQAAFDESEARWKAATAETERAAEGVRAMQTRVGEADAQVAGAEAAVAEARAYLSYGKIAAPFAGLITRKSVDVGDLAAPGAPLLELERTDLYRLEAVVNETLAQALRVGDSTEVRLDALGAESCAGKISEIVPATDPASRTLVVKIDLPADLPVKSGMFGRARFMTGSQSLLAIPETALARRGQLTSVFVVTPEGTARLRLVTTGRQIGDRIEVLSGLDAGEAIVADNLAQVSDGCGIRRK